MRPAIAAICIEPIVQGAGGMIVQPAGFLRAVRELASQYDVLLIADEVATGFGRTGQNVRLRARGRFARPDVRRQGNHRRLSAPGRDVRHAARSTMRSWPTHPKAKPSITATPTPEIPWPVPRLLPRSICSSGTTLWHRFRRKRRRCREMLDDLRAAAPRRRDSPEGIHGRHRAGRG